MLEGRKENTTKWTPTMAQTINSYEIDQKLGNDDKRKAKTQRANCETTNNKRRRKKDKYVQYYSKLYRLKRQRTGTHTRTHTGRAVSSCIYSFNVFSVLLLSPSHSQFLVCFWSVSCMRRRFGIFIFYFDEFWLQRIDIARSEGDLCSTSTNALWHFRSNLHQSIDMNNCIFGRESERERERARYGRSIRWHCIGWNNIVRST